MTKQRKKDPDLDRIFGAAFSMMGAVTQAQWRDAGKVALLPASGAALVWGVPQGFAVPTLTLPLYVATIAVALAWNLRACLGAMHPGAQGVGVPLGHFVWRIAIAFALTLVPAVAIFVMVNGGLDPASGWFTLAIFAAIALSVTMYALAAVTAARVAATGRFSPLEAWSLLRGRRGVAIGSLCLLFATAIGFGGFLYLPSFALEAMGVPWLIAIIPGGVLTHGAILLGLAAVATAIHDLAAGPPPMAAAP